MLPKSQYKFRIKLPFCFYKLIDQGALKSKDVLVYLSITQDSKEYSKSERSITADTGLSRQFVHDSIKRLVKEHFIKATPVRLKDTIIDDGEELDIWNPYFQFENTVPFWNKLKKEGEKFRFVPKYLLLLPTSAEMCTQVHTDIHSYERKFTSGLRPIDLAVFVFLLSRHPDRYVMNVTRDAARCGVAINTFKKSLLVLKELRLISISRTTGRTKVHSDDARTFVRVKDKLQEAKATVKIVEVLEAEKVNFLRKDIELCEDKVEFAYLREKIHTYSVRGEICHELALELTESLVARRSSVGF